MEASQVTDRRKAEREMQFWLRRMSADVFWRLYRTMYRAWLNR